MREFDGKKMTMTVTPKDGAYNWNVEIIERENNNEEEVHSENIQEQSFPLQVVRNSLEKLFSNINMFDQNDSEASETSMRVYFACQK